jgi:sugar O-acyltransferase (sialic acid O-acetyltransferase NeuD family)
MARVLIFGAGDIARLAHYYLTNDSPHEVVGFVVDRGFRTHETLFGLAVLEADDAYARFPPGECAMFVALSYNRMNRTRAEKFYAAKERGYSLVSYVSSRCTYLAPEPPGENAFILEDNTVQPFVRIGHNVTLWSGNHIGHDSVIDDHCFLTSQVVVSGNCHIKPYCFIGVNATLRNSIVVAEQTLIGAGAVIMKNTQPKGVYLPARAELFAKDSDQIEL